MESGTAAASGGAQPEMDHLGGAVLTGRTDFLFEACVDSLYSALQAERGGAGRLELCSALSQGGITPSYGMIRAVKDEVHIPLHVLIRPRAGDFCYTETEVKVIIEDIHMAGQLGVHGIAFGALTPDGNIDMNLVCTRLLYIRYSIVLFMQMKSVVHLCKTYGLAITFHRAFDAVKSSENALQDLLELGIPRLLTSGQAPTVDEGLPVLRMLVQKSQGRISIMPGGGITTRNAANIVRTLGVSELHGSARSDADFGRCFINARIKAAMTGPDIPMATDWKKVQDIVEACSTIRR